MAPAGRLRAGSPSERDPFISIAAGPSGAREVRGASDKTQAGERAPLRTGQPAKAGGRGATLAVRADSRPGAPMPVREPRKRWHLLSDKGPLSHGLVAGGRRLRGCRLSSGTPGAGGSHAWWAFYVSFLFSLSFISIYLSLCF